MTQLTCIICFKKLRIPFKHTNHISFRRKIAPRSVRFSYHQAIVQYIFAQYDGCCVLGITNFFRNHCYDAPRYHHDRRDLHQVGVHILW